MRMAPVGSKFPGSVGQFDCHQTPITPHPPFQRILWGGGRNNTLMPLVPNCTVAQPVTTSVDSVQLIWEGMHEANGAGRRQGGLASGVGDAVTPRAPVWHTVAAHVGAADGATRNTPCTRTKPMS